MCKYNAEIMAKLWELYWHKGKGMEDRLRQQPTETRSAQGLLLGIHQ